MITEARGINGIFQRQHINGRERTGLRKKMGRVHTEGTRRGENNSGQGVIEKVQPKRQEVIWKASESWSMRAGYKEEEEGELQC